MSAALTLSDQIVASCVGLLLTHEVVCDPDWSALLVDEMHARLPECSVTHPEMAPLLREIPKAWPKGGVLPTGTTGLWRARRAWVELTKWRLGQAVEHAQSARVPA